MAARGADVAIRIGADFVGKKAFKQADNSVVALTKSVAKLAGGYLTLQKAQMSVMNAIADEKAAKVLAQNLKNLDLGFAIKSSEEFIATMQKQTGILDDDLRPAYAQLARVTGSSLETQKLMSLAFDVSAGSGQDFSKVINTLSQAYVGNNKGLRSLNVGLSAADLKTKSFAEITDILNQKFKGSGEASLDSYAGKMALLKVATADASEVIGKSLLDAITTASGQDGFPKFIRLIEGATNILSDLITGVGRTIRLIDIIASPSKGVSDIIRKVRNQYAIWNREDLQVAKERNGVAKNFTSFQSKQAAAQILATKNAQIQAKLEKDRLATLKKQNAEKAAQAAIDKANQMLNTAKGVFDIDQIQVQAALQNQTLTENERKRLEIKQAIFALEAALDAQDQKRIASGTTLLGSLLGQFATLQAQDTLLGKIKSAYDALGMNKDLINLTNLQEALRLLQQMNLLMNGTKTPTASTALAAPTGSPYVYSPISKPYPEMVGNAQADLTNTLSAAAWDLHEKTISRTMNPNYTPTVNITVTENSKKLVDVIMDTVTDQSANGNLPYIVRNGQQLAW